MEKAMSLTREEMKSVKPNTRKISVPEFGGDGHMYICALPASCIDQIENDQGNIKKSAKLVAQSICDETGQRILEDTDADLVLAWPIHVFTRITNEVEDHNGLSERNTPAEIRKQIAELEAKLAELETNPGN